MFTYPLLSPSEQADLPCLNAAATLLPSQFADSSHQVFLCDTVDGRMVLKVCDKVAVAQSGFWQGANHLFGADFPASLARIQHTHDFLTSQGSYQIPDFVAASLREFSHQFVLTRFIEGEDVTAADVTDDMVAQLAHHIAQLHQQAQSTWGNLYQPNYTAGEWSGRLHATLSALAAQSDVKVPKALLQQILSAVKQLQESEFVPMMLDLRWDQFRKVGNAQSEVLALIDLDAFVMAPRALDLVLLEYILTPPQFALFKSITIKVHDWPDYTLQKPCYQLLLFLMQVLGETDLEKWMNQV